MKYVPPTAAELNAEIQAANRILVDKDFTDISEVNIKIHSANEGGKIHAMITVKFKTGGRQRVYIVSHTARSGDTDYQYREMCFPEVIAKCSLALQAGLIQRFKEELGDPPFPEQLK